MPPMRALVLSLVVIVARAASVKPLSALLEPSPEPSPAPDLQGVKVPPQHPKPAMDVKLGYAMAFMAKELTLEVKLLEDLEVLQPYIEKRFAEMNASNASVVVDDVLTKYLNGNNTETVKAMQLGDLNPYRVHRKTVDVNWKAEEGMVNEQRWGAAFMAFGRLVGMGISTFLRRVGGRLIITLRTIGNLAINNPSMQDHQWKWDAMTQFLESTLGAYLQDQIDFGVVTTDQPNCAPQDWGQILGIRPLKPECVEWNHAQTRCHDVNVFRHAAHIYHPFCAHYLDNNILDARIAFVHYYTCNMYHTYLFRHSDWVHRMERVAILINVFLSNVDQGVIDCPHLYGSDKYYNGYPVGEPRVAEWMQCMHQFYLCWRFQ